MGAGDIDGLFDSLNDGSEYLFVQVVGGIRDDDDSIFRFELCGNLGYDVLDRGLVFGADDDDLALMSERSLISFSLCGLGVLGVEEDISLFEVVDDGFVEIGPISADVGYAVLICRDGRGGRNGTIFVLGGVGNGVDAVFFKAMRK